MENERLRQRVIEQVATAILTGRTDGLPGDASCEEVALAIDVADRARWEQLQVEQVQSAGGAA